VRRYAYVYLVNTLFYGIFIIQKGEKKHGGSVNTVNGYPRPPSPPGRKTARSHSFSCNIFRRQHNRRGAAAKGGGQATATAQFLDYGGQNFEDYYRKNGQLHCQAGTFYRYIPVG
jgi:hypothetical protein